MNETLVEATASIEDPAARRRVEALLAHDLPAFAGALDRLAEAVGADGPALRPERSAQLRRLLDEAVSRAEAATSGLDEQIAQRLRSGFRALRPQHYYASQIIHQGLVKPRGYPGDFEMMNHVYDQRPCSSTPLGRCWDQAFLDAPYAEAVRGRKDRMVELLLRAVDGAAGPSLRVLNLPCGPARDVQELVQHPALRRDLPLELVCVDQDEEALAYARRAVGQPPPGVRVDLRQGNILSFVRRPGPHAAALGSFDLVYSIGLADYLPDRLLTKMIRFSWDLLRPGGQTTYAFKIHDRDPVAPLPPKWICDWQFVPRSLEDARRLMAAVAGDQPLAVDWERSGRIAFLTATRPGAGASPVV